MLKIIPLNTYHGYCLTAPPLPASTTPCDLQPHLISVCIFTLPIFFCLSSETKCAFVLPVTSLGMQSVLWIYYGNNSTVYSYCFDVLLGLKDKGYNF